MRLFAPILWACVLISSSSADYTSKKPAFECSACSEQASIYMRDFLHNYGTYAKAIDGARYHCGRLATASDCYTACQNDDGLIGLRSDFMKLYKNYCDPACSVAVVPWCYLNTVGAYDQSRSCSGGQIRSDLKDCLDAELFGKQDCTGACTRGQRSANFFFMQTLMKCTFPVIIQPEVRSPSDNSCSTLVHDCSRTTFGTDGAPFTEYANVTLQNHNFWSCSVYYISYFNCLNASVNGRVKSGNLCHDSITAVQGLVDYVRNRLVKPFCDAPDQTMNDTCLPRMTPALSPAAAAAAITTAVATTTASAATAAATTEPSASPHQSTVVSATTATSALTATNAEAKPAATVATVVSEAPATPATLTYSAASKTLRSGWLPWSWPLLPLFFLAALL